MSIFTAIKLGQSCTGQGQSGLPILRGLEEPCRPMVRHSELGSEDLRLAGEFWDGTDMADVEDCRCGLVTK